MLQDKLVMDAVSFSQRYNLTASRIYDHDRQLIVPPNIPRSQAEALQRGNCQLAERLVQACSGKLSASRETCSAAERLIQAEMFKLDDF